MTTVVLKSPLLGLPHTITTTVALLEISLIITSISPTVLAEPFGHAINVLAHIMIAVAIMFFPLAMLEAILETASEKITSDLLVHSLAIGQSAPPLSFVVFHKLVRFGVAGGETEPIEGATTMLFVIKEMPQVEVVIGVDLHTLSTFLVIVELALVKFAITLEVNPPSLSTLAVHLAEVDLVITLDEFQLRTVQQGFCGQCMLREGGI